MLFVAAVYFILFLSPTLSVSLHVSRIPEILIWLCADDAFTLRKYDRRAVFFSIEQRIALA